MHKAALQPAESGEIAIIPHQAETSELIRRVTTGRRRRSYAPFLLSWEAIPSGTTSAILKDHVFLYEISEMILKRVPTRAGYLDHIPHGDAAMVTGIIQNRDGQLGHCCQGDLLSLNLEGKSAHLLL